MTYQYKLLKKILNTHAQRHTHTFSLSLSLTHTHTHTHVYVQLIPPLWYHCRRTTLTQVIEYFCQNNTLIDQYNYQRQIYNTQK